MGDDAFDAAGADGPAGLTEFWGDDGRGGLGIEEAMANDLANDFVGAAGGTLGAAFVAVQGQGAAVGEGLAELEVALFAEAEFAGGLDGAKAFARAFEEHGEFAGDFVVGRHGQGAGGADELLEFEVEVSHGRAPGSYGIGKALPRGV
jgi:hypothetical protein